MMKGFFDGIDPVDGICRHDRRLLALGRVPARGAAVGDPGLTALAMLCWLFTWNEFLFALILTGNKTPMITVVMAQFVTRWAWSGT